MIALPFHGTGSLFETYDPNQSIGEDWSGLHSCLSQHPTARPGWIELTYSSPTPLINESLPDPAGLHHYYFLLRRSRRRFLLVSSDLVLVTKLLDLIELRKRVFAPSVDVTKLTGDLVRTPCEYCLGVVFAKVDGYGQALRSMSLYGSDLGEAQLFATLLPQILPTRVTLRDVRTKQEVLSCSSQGEVAFQYGATRSLKAVDDALSFLSRGGYVKWPDIESAEE